MIDMTASKPPDTLRVGEAMHTGLISCSPETQLRTVARMMSTNRVHAILVRPPGERGAMDGERWGIVESKDVLRAAASTDLGLIAARKVMKSPVPVVSVDDELTVAAVRMVVHDLSHVLVVEPRSARPIGVLSALDIARASAGFPERHPASGWREEALAAEQARA